MSSNRFCLSSVVVVSAKITLWKIQASERLLSESAKKWFSFPSKHLVMSMNRANHAFLLATPINHTHHQCHAACYAHAQTAGLLAVTHKVQRRQHGHECVGYVLSRALASICYLLLYVCCTYCMHENKKCTEWTYYLSVYLIINKQAQQYQGSAHTGRRWSAPTTSQPF